MDFTIILTKDLIQRNAMNLVYSLNEINSSVFLYKESGRGINGRSVLGVLSGDFKQGETIKILIDNTEELSRIKEIFKQYGTEVL